MQFPIYRKYNNEFSFFIIHSLTEWTEFKRLGKKFIEHHFTATQFPEKMFIQDLIELQEGIAISSLEEINKIKNL